MILVQYGDLVSNIKDRFRCVNAELQFELANYFRQDILWTITRHEYDKLPARAFSRRRVCELFKLFWLTCRCVQLLNETYGGIILAMLLMSSVQLIAIPQYFIIPLFYTTETVTTFLKLSALCDALWMCVVACELIVLVVIGIVTTYLLFSVQIRNAVSNFYKLMLLAPVSEIHNPETMEKSYIFHEYQFRVNLLLVSLMSIGQIVSMYYRFQELHPNGKRSGNPDSDHFIPDKMIIFAAFILSSMILALVGVVKTKTNFNRLLSLHKTLCHIDSLLQRPSKRGKFKYIAAFLIFLNATLLAMDYCVWKFTTVERVIFSLCLFSRLMCTTILVQYGDIVLTALSFSSYHSAATSRRVVSAFLVHDSLRETSERSLRGPDFRNDSDDFIPAHRHPSFSDLHVRQHDEALVENFRIPTKLFAPRLRGNGYLKIETASTDIGVRVVSNLLVDLNPNSKRCFRFVNKLE
ncbi:unnamed protein product [Bemisia tabaci]|uniref:Gustatory receptor n=1 Tax=Bemisia tabaci TaxID=7038 RepID=A0A9P0ACA3_BEMTA|nr:unnamed protein product [Bemisia tabaci]